MKSRPQLRLLNLNTITVPNKRESIAIGAKKRAGIWDFFLAAEVRQGSVDNVVSVAMKETTSVKPCRQAVAQQLPHVLLAERLAFQDVRVAWQLIGELWLSFGQLGFAGGVLAVGPMQ